jgi:hypothetical protein
MYDSLQKAAPIIVRSKEDLETPWVHTFLGISQLKKLTHFKRQNMSHCYLRAMHPVHMKCQC